MNIKRISFYSILVAISVGMVFFNYGRSVWYPIYIKINGQRTTQEVIQRYGPAAENRLLEYFQTADVAYPPEKISLVAFKDSKTMELWAHHGEKSVMVKEYTIHAASGNLGPKLREGDRQVPEGIYTIDYFNPNSSYHLSMKLNYPNDFDKKYADIEGRTEPGTNIFIHGKAVSIGCLAMGDVAIEELFTLSHKVNRKNVKVVISPSKPVNGKLIVPENSPPWVKELYEIIVKELKTTRT